MWPWARSPRSAAEHKVAGDDRHCPDRVLTPDGDLSTPDRDRRGVALAAIDRNGEVGRVCRFRNVGIDDVPGPVANVQVRAAQRHLPLSRSKGADQPDIPLLRRVTVE